MSRATKYRTCARDPGRVALLVGGTLVALAVPAVVVGALALASGGDIPARALGVLAADPATLAVGEALVYWGVAISAVGTWLVGAGLVLEGLGR